MSRGRKVPTTTHDDADSAGYVPTRSGIFLCGVRSPRLTEECRRDADVTLDWLERIFARRYEGDEALARLARIYGRS